MKIIDAFHIGSKSLTAHKKHNFITLIAVSLLFGLLLGVNFILQGLENKLLDLSSEKTKAKHFLQVTVSDGEGRAGDEKKIEQTKSKVEEYGGKVVGSLAIGDGGNVLSDELTKYIFGVDRPNAPENQIAVVIDSKKAQDLLDIKIHNRLSNEEKMALFKELNQKMKGATFTAREEHAKEKTHYNEDDYQEELTSPEAVLKEDASDTKYFVLEVLPFGTDTPQLRKLVDELRLLDTVLFTIAEGSAQKILIGSEHIKQEEAGGFRLLAEFQDTEKMFRYYLENDCSDFDNNCRDINISDAFGNPLSILMTFKSVRIFLNIAVTVLTVIAVIITTFSFLRLVNQEVSNIALFKIMGAKKRDIATIYLVFLLEMALLTILISLVVGFLLALSISLIESADLSANLSVFYNVEVKQPLLLFGLNTQVFSLISIILLTSLLTIVLTLDQFSDKNIFRKLRQN